MQPAPKRGCLPVLLQIYNILAFIGLGLAALFLLCSSFGSGRLAYTIGIDSNVLTLVGVVLLLIVVQGISLFRIRKTSFFTIPATLRARAPFKAASIAMIAWVVVLLLGEFFTGSGVFTFLQAILNILAVGLPLWWLFELGRRKLPPGSELTTQGALSFSTTLIPILTIFAELLALAIFVLLVFSAFRNQPGFLDLFRSFIERSSPEISQQQLRQLSGIVLQDPRTIAFLILFVSGIAPLIEELCKPLAILIFGRERPTPSQGFVLGMMCGACFAFLESISSLSNAGWGWYLVVIVRTAAGMLHMVASGIAGWGYAVAVNGKGPGKAFLGLLVAFGLHGIWNFFAILVSLAPMIAAGELAAPPVLLWAGYAAPYMMILLSILMIVFLHRVNRRFQRSLPPQPPEPVL